MADTAHIPISGASVAFLVCAGRDGGGFMQSLLDSHPQILMLPMELKFYQVWEELKAENINDPAEMVEAWCAGSKLRKLDQGVRYGFGEGEDDYTPCDFSLFKRRFLELLKTHGLARKTVFLALNQAYAESIGQDAAKVGCVVEFSAYPEFLPYGLEDFPEAKILQMIRDPRGSFASSKGHFIRTYGILFHPKGDGPDGKLLHSQILEALRKHLDTLWSVRKRLPVERFTIVRLDDLHLDNEATMRRVAERLEIDFAPSLVQSTLGGKAWLGNSSTGKPVSGVNPAILTRWRQTLAPREIALVESLFGPEMDEFGWERQGPGSSRLADTARCLLPFPGEFSYAPVARKAGDKRLKALEALHPSLVGLVRAARAWLVLVPQAAILYPYSRRRLMRLVAAAKGKGTPQ